MKRFLAALGLLALVSACIPTADYRSSVVHIRADGVCTGFVVNAKHGIIVTAQHCVGATDKLATVTFFDGSTNTGKFIREDAINDTAVLQLDDVPTKLKELPLRCDIPARYGEEITLIGMPADVFRWYTSWGRVAGFGVANNSPFTDYKFVWLNVAGTGGNSGGPVIDSLGRVIAVLTVKLEGGSMLGAVPIQAACKLVLK